jgi:hypothetical protein
MENLKCAKCNNQLTPYEPYYSGGEEFLPNSNLTASDKPARIDYKCTNPDCENRGAYLNEYGEPAGHFYKGFQN